MYGKRSFILTIGSLLLINSCKNGQFENQIKDCKPLQKVVPIQLNFLAHWLGEGKKEQFMKEIVNEFEFTNQDVKVHLVWADSLYNTRGTSDGEAAFNAKVIKSVKPEWDIIRINNSLFNLGHYMNETDPNWPKKYFVDFSEIEEFKKNTRPELLTEESLTQYYGIAPGPFIDGNNWALWCNTEVAQKVGIEVKQFDMTSEDFLNYLKATNEYNKTHNDSIIALYDAGDWRTSKLISDMLFFSEVGNYDEIVNKAISEKKIAAWWKVLKELERYAVFKPLPLNWRKISWGSSTNYPLDGKCLFYINATWMYNIWLKMDSKKLQTMIPVELPVYKRSPLCFGGYGSAWAVPKNAPHKDQAIRFLLFINRPDVAEKWARYTKSPTGIKGNLTNSSFGLDKLENYQYEIDQRYGKHKVNTLYDAAYCFGKENASVPVYSDEVLSGAMTAEQAIKEIRRQLKKR